MLLPIRLELGHIFIRLGPTPPTPPSLYGVKYEGDGKHIHEVTQVFSYNLHAKAVVTSLRIIGESLNFFQACLVF